MGHPRRLFPRGDIFHVSNGAADGRVLFPSDGDYARFAEFLDRRAWYGSTRLFGYCLMPTHWHLVLSPWSGWDLSAYVRGLTLMHARWWHERCRTRGAGRIYRGQFRAFAVEPGAALLAVLRHVERNPVRAGLVRRAEDWRWSSLADRLDPGRAPTRLLGGPVLLSPDWVGYVNELPPAAEWSAVRESIERGWPLGSADWRRQTADRLGLTLRRRGRPRKGVE
jgi:putative transposase